MFKNIQSKKDLTNKKKNKNGNGDGNINNLTSLVEVPDGMYEKCPSCSVLLPLAALHANAFLCEHCGHHFRMHVASRAAYHFDSFQVFNHRINSVDPLNFPGYKEKLEDLRNLTGMHDAVLCGEASLQGHELIAVIMDPNFMMGSMGTVVGEKITRAFERAQKQKKPIVIFCASGGARMQEGLMSLMQMAKTAGAVQAFDGLYVSVLCDPTTGGVSASFAMLGDIILAEPKSLIGFAGPRVIAQTINADLPEGFQSAEFLLEKGFIDKIVNRKNLSDTLSTILSLHEVKS